MSTRFIGNAHGLVLSCNHGDVSIGERPVLDGDGKPLIEKGLPVYEHTFPEKCTAKLQTAQVIRSGIRHYAKTQKWLTVEMGGRQRDFCPEHGPVRLEQIKNRKADAERVAAEKKAARDAKEKARREAHVARLEGWKRKREEREAAKEQRRRAREAKKAA